MRTCIDEAVAACSPDMEAVDIAYNLFSYRYGPTSPNGCDGPFSGIESAISPTHHCTYEFLDGLYTSLEVGLTMSSVCEVLTVNYTNCLQSGAADPASVTSILNPAVDYISDVRNIFCKTGVFSWCERE